jgi:hypothetical protein
MNAKTIFPLLLAFIFALSIGSNSFAGAKGDEVTAGKNGVAANLGGSQMAAPDSGSLDSSSFEIEDETIEDLGIFGAGAIFGVGALVGGLLALIL